MEKLDAKFYGEVRKAKNDEIVPDDQWICFLAKDDAFAEILPQYYHKCIELRCDEQQLQAIRRMMERVFAWRLNNSDKCKVPDAAGEKLLDQKEGGHATVTPEQQSSSAKPSDTTPAKKTVIVGG